MGRRHSRGDRFLTGAALIIGVFIGGSGALGAVRYVKAAAGGVNDGTSWTDAYTSLQAALSVAVAGDEVWVGIGTYKPSAPGGQASTFTLGSNIAIYGGFRGLAGDEGTNNAVTRPPDANPAVPDPATDSILSGDLAGNDNPDPQGSNFAGYGENCYHVVTGSNTNASAVLDGFTIRGGHGQAGAADESGGGIYVLSGSPTVFNCTFWGNMSHSNGGGGYFANTGTPSNPTFTKCFVTGNRAVTGGGGGFHFQGINNPKLTECTLSGNSTTGGSGGALYHSDGAGAFVSCRFLGNSAFDVGGAAAIAGGNPSFVNCSFSGNFSINGIGKGGAIGSIGSGTTSVANCSFSENRAFSGGGDSLYTNNGSATINAVNCVIVGHSATDNVISDGGTINISYSDVVFGGIYPGAGNINGDPLFVDADGNNNIFGDLDDDLHIPGWSPCVDTGNSSFITPGESDIDGQARVQGCRVDQGADEALNGAGHSGDMDGSGLIGLSDVPIFVNALIYRSANCTADLNYDGVVDGRDVGPFVDCLLGGPCGVGFSDGLPIDEHRVFVTSTTHNGNLGGIAGADAMCQSCAQNAGLQRTYRAIICAPGDNAVDRLVISGPVWIWTGAGFEKVVDDAADLWDGSIDRTIDYAEFGNFVGNSSVHTGCNPDGSATIRTCTSWSSSSGQGTLGNSSLMSSGWITSTFLNCSIPMRLYCVSQP